MKTAILILSVVAAASAHFLPYYAPAAATYFRTPSLDSSYVESNRVGGNFAYRTVEGHAYQAVPSYYPYADYHPTFAGPAPFLPYQPAFFEQPVGMKPMEMPAMMGEKPKDFMPPINEGRQIDEDTVAVEAA